MRHGIMGHACDYIKCFAGVTKHTLGQVLSQHECRECGGELPPHLCEDKSKRCHADIDCKHFWHICQGTCPQAAEKGYCRKVRGPVPTCQDVLTWDPHVK